MAAVAVALALGLAPAVFGLDVSMDVQPRTLRIGEAATLSITIQGQTDAPSSALPEIPGFQVSAGQRSSNVEISGNQQRSSVTYTYQLSPTRLGTFNVGPFTFASGNERVELPAVQVRVEGERNLSDLLFATISTQATNIYHQQSFDLTIAVYSRDLNVDAVSLVDMPTTGLRLQEFRQMGNSREMYNNQLYDVRRFRCRATALTAGEFILAPVLRVGILTQRQRQREIFDPFGFFGGMESHPQDITARPLTLGIKSLPNDGRPSNFAGAVGRFVFDATAKPTELAAGDPVTLTMTLSGEGNIDLVSPPQFAAGTGFRVYEPKLVANEVDTDRGVGRKMFEQVVIPKSAEATNLPTLSFSYFDPESARYQTITRGPFTLMIRPGSNDSARLVQAGESRAAATKQFLGTDIGYLKAAPSRWQRVGDRAWYAHPIFLGLQTVPPLALAIVMLAVRRRDELSRDISKARRQQAPKAARAALARAEKALAADDRRDYFEALWEGLASYFGHRYNLSPGEVTRDVVLSRLPRSLDPQHVQHLREMFDRFEQERFGMRRNEPLSTEERGLHTQLNAALRACEGARA